ncbi:MAG TPA: hypothetical protein VFW71_00925 [Actinomycetota bacterium]|nr:hypothetical protein [Actinomycetota bacterium]
MKQRIRTGIWAAVVLAALLVLAACSTQASNNGAPAELNIGGTPSPASSSDGVATVNLGGTPSPGSTSASGAKGTKATPKASSTAKAKAGATPSGSTGQGGSTGNGNGVTYNQGTFTITHPTPGSTFSFPGQIGGNPTPQPTSIKASPTPTACTLPGAPATNGVGVTAVHLDSVDSSGVAHGPQTTFSAASVHSILVVATLDPSVNVTGTVITYAQLLCSNVESTQDLTLSGPTSTGQLYIRFDTPTGQSFPTGKYRLILYVNPSTANSQPAQYIDYIIN